jgi:hypothetical protein
LAALAISSGWVNHPVPDPPAPDPDPGPGPDPGPLSFLYLSDEVFVESGGGRAYSYRSGVPNIFGMTVFPVGDDVRFAVDTVDLEMDTIGYPIECPGVISAENPLRFSIIPSVNGFGVVLMPGEGHVVMWQSGLIDRRLHLFSRMTVISETGSDTVLSFVGHLFMQT